MHASCFSGWFKDRRFSIGYAEAVLMRRSRIKLDANAVVAAQALEVVGEAALAAGARCLMDDLPGSGQQVGAGEYLARLLISAMLGGRIDGPMLSGCVASPHGIRTWGRHPAGQFLYLLA